MIAPNGDETPPMRGVRLDGSDGNLHIVDSDAGMLDGDAGLDRAMGPMQFIPETWRLYGVDGNNDGKISPDNFDDAALSAAGYLCWRGQEHELPARLVECASGVQPLRSVRPHGAGLGDGISGR